jgi:hypothetical protein
VKLTRWLQRLATHNIGWKLGSLAAAVGLWLLVVAPVSVVTLSAEVGFANLPANMALDERAPRTVVLEVGQPVLTRIDVTGSKVILDLSEVTRPGEYSFEVTSAQVALPEGAVLRSASPPQLKLVFDRREAALQERN